MVSVFDQMVECPDLQFWCLWGVCFVKCEEEIRRLVKSSLINHVEENFGSVGGQFAHRIEDSLFSLFWNGNIHNSLNGGGLQLSSPGCATSQIATTISNFGC